MHVWSLAQQLLLLGHHVIVITHFFGERIGVRTMTNNLRVYYLPFPPFAQDNSFPAIFHSLPLFREIFIREKIEIVHGHQATSSMMHEALLHAKLMGLKTVFTEHSLFEFGDAASVNLNKILKFTLSACDRCIGVSEACRTNLILRASLDPNTVVAIPNAVDAVSFRPDPTAAPDPNERVNIIVISRLAYRKGMDLVARVIPIACERWPHVHFVIGGGGPKRLLLDEMVERYNLHSRVELIGEVPHAQVRSVLTRGSVFLNCSLTESFCIAILEAACAGLMVVSTRVGGVPEVLPDDMIRFPAPNAPSVVDGLVDALEEALQVQVDPMRNHRRLSEMYSWRSVAMRTVDQVYDKVVLESNVSFFDNLDRYRSLGPIAGILAVWVVAIDSIVLWFLGWYAPEKSIAPVPQISGAKRKVLS